MTTPSLPVTEPLPPSHAAGPTDTITRLLAEGFIGSAAAARLLGQLKGGRPVHPGTIARWVLRGVRTGDGRTVRLEAARVSGKFVTSKPAIIRFLADQQAHHTASAIPRSPRERDRVSDAAGRRLEDAGA
jgi:hypothetical protein